MNFKAISKQIGTGILSLGTAFVSATILGELIFGHGGSEIFLPFLETLNVSATLLVTLGLTSGTAIFTGKKFLQLRKNVKLLEEENIKKEILRLAVLNGGSLNLSQSILEIDISVEEAKSILDNLSQKGIFQTEFNHEGVAIYHLTDFVNQSQIQNNTSFVQIDLDTI